MRRLLAAALAVAALAEAPAEAPLGLLNEALASDDECAAGGDGGSPPHCALSALQLRGRGARAESTPLEGEVDAHASSMVSDWRAQQALDDGSAVLSAGPSGNGDLVGVLGASSVAPSPYLPPYSPPSKLHTLSRDSVKPPSRATEYNGIAWPDMVFHGTDEMHAFAIADWGGLLGEMFNAAPGLHVFAIMRAGCSINDMTRCFQIGWNETLRAEECKPECGYVYGVDEKAQYLVADAMRARAKWKGVQYFLNAGDNFYPFGIDTGCGNPMHQIADATKEQFEKVFQWVYWGKEFDGKPWLSVLGNHDYGARQFNYAWDQQIAYTWASDRWLLPAQFFSQHVEYPDQDFSVDYYMLDSNVMDTEKICAARYNAQANCGSSGGPTDPQHCRWWFQALWAVQAQWLERKLAESTADWQIVVTHFPCGHKRDWYRELRQRHGLDLLVTGHVHLEQIQFLPGGLTCVVTGGGGGITSEQSPVGDMTNQYGFFDITLGKSQLKLELVNFLGNVVRTHNVQPYHPNTGDKRGSDAVHWHPQAEVVVPAASGQPMGNRTAACDSNPGCEGLSGNCCPTDGGAMLGCC